MSGPDVGQLTIGSDTRYGLVGRRGLTQPSTPSVDGGEPVVTVSGVGVAPLTSGTVTAGPE